MSVQLLVRPVPPIPMIISLIRMVGCMRMVRCIIDLLPVKDATRTSVSSSRWKNLWKCVSNIELHYIRYLSRDGINSASSFLDVIDSILIHHDSCDIKRFVVSYDVRVDPKRIHHWICEVIKHNVQELRINVSFTYRPYTLPLCLFKSESLTDFEIDMGPFEQSVILGSSDSSAFSVHLPNLKRLKLSRVYFLNNNSIQQLFSNIPNLQQLCLSECSWENINRLIIDIPTLKGLDVDIDDWNDFDCRVTVIAPSLISFNCRTDFSIDFLLSNYSLSLNVFLEALSYQGQKRHALFRLLESFKQLTALHLTWHFIQGLNSEGIAANELPVFMNLTQLEISATKYDVFIDFNLKHMLMLLHNMPNLQSLAITLPSEEYESHTLFRWPTDGDFSSDDVPSCVVYGIKKVSISSKIDTCAFSKNSMAMRLVEYFMNRSRSLEMLKLNGGRFSKGLYLAWGRGHEKIERHYSRYLELEKLFLGS